MSKLAEFGLGDRLKVVGKIQSVGIVGCGSVGMAITLLVARYGMEVVFVDVSTERINEIFTNLETQLDDEIVHWELQHRRNAWYCRELPVLPILLD